MRLTLVALASAVHFVTSVVASADSQFPLRLNGLIDEATFTVDPEFVNEAGFDFSILGNQRLVELEDGSVSWMTELDKVDRIVRPRRLMMLLKVRSFSVDQDEGSRSLVR